MSTLTAIRDDLEAALLKVDGLIAAEPPVAGSGQLVEPPKASAGLRDPAAFFASVRAAAPLGPTLSPEEVFGCERILKACAGQPLSWAAYILATAVHETAGKLTPLREYGKGAGRAYGKPGRNRGQIPYGRGDVQLTWDDNYEKADRELGLNGALIADYDKALDPQVSARILVKGMTEGWFTGKSLNSYLPSTATVEQFRNARRIVNGTDKADLIASYAATFQSALLAGGWT